jgi:hypothetical protein
MYLAMEDYEKILNWGGQFDAWEMVRGDRFIVGIRFKGFHSIKISKFNEQNKSLITYWSFDYLELPHCLIELDVLDHTSYES